MNRYAVIAAGGTGTRMGADKPKQFLTLLGKTILEHSLRAFFGAFPDIHFVVALPAEFLPMEPGIRAMLPQAAFSFVAGGETRYHSVKNGLSVVPGSEESIVFVHDAARCLVSPALIQLCSDTAELKGSAIPVADIHDSLRVVQQPGTSSILDRNTVKAVQTPQTFRSSIIQQAFAQPYQPSFTDEASVAEAAGFPVHLVMGETTNIKVTTPFDLLLAELVLKERE